MKTKFFLFIIVTLLVVSKICAQHNLLTAAAGIADAGGTVEYSVGQLTFHLVSGDDGSLMEGVQQPWEIQIMPGFSELPGVGLKCSLYPNPATTFITLEITGREPAGMECRISDMNGRILKNVPIHHTITTIAADDLPGPSCLVTLIENNLPLITYKLIKQ